MPALFFLFFPFKAHSLQLRSLSLLGVVDAYDQGGLGYADGNDKQVAGRCYLVGGLKGGLPPTRRYNRSSCPY